MEVKINKEKRGYSASIFDIGVFTQGDSFEDLLKNLEDALEVFLTKEANKEYKVDKKIKLLQKMKSFTMIV